MPKRKVAVWRKVGKVFYAKPPDWPKSTEYSCMDQETLIEWAHNHGYILKDGNLSKRDGRSYNDRFAARDFGWHRTVGRADGICGDAGTFRDGAGAV